MKQYLFSNLKLRRHGSNISIGGRALIPHKVILIVVEMLQQKDFFFIELVPLTFQRCPLGFLDKTC
jgi:hypothetical protein